MFFKIPPISNTCVSAAYILATVHFLYPKLDSFSDMEYYFYQLAYRDSKVPKRFVGLSSALPLLTETGVNKMTPLHVGTSYTHGFGFIAREMSQLPTRLRRRGHQTPNCVGGEGAAPPSNPHLTG